MIKLIMMMNAEGVSWWRWTHQEDYDDDDDDDDVGDDDNDDDNDEEEEDKWRMVKMMMTMMRMMVKMMVVVTMVVTRTTMTMMLILVKSSYEGWRWWWWWTQMKNDVNDEEQEEWRPEWGREIFPFAETRKSSTDSAKRIWLYMFIFFLTLATSTQFQRWTAETNNFRDQNRPRRKIDWKRSSWQQGLSEQQLHWKGTPGSSRSTDSFGDMECWKG